MTSSILIAILLIILVAAAAFWVIDRSFPGDFNWIAKLIVGIIALIAILKHLPGGAIF